MLTLGPKTGERVAQIHWSRVMAFCLSPSLRNLLTPSHFLSLSLLLKHATTYRFYRAKHHFVLVFQVRSQHFHIPSITLSMMLTVTLPIATTENMPWADNLYCEHCLNNLYFCLWENVCCLCLRRCVARRLQPLRMEAESREKQTGILYCSRVNDGWIYLWSHYAPT